MSKRTLLTYFSNNSNINSTPTPNTGKSTNQPKKPKVKFRFLDIIGDLGDRKPIDEYPFEIRDQVKQAYVLHGPTQPGGQHFLTTGN